MTFEEIRKLYDVYDNSFGFSDEEIDKNEQRLNIKLPLVLRRYYAQLGNNDLINQAQHNLCKPDELRIEEDFLIFYIENQGIVLWGIKTDDLEKDDPIIFMNMDGDGWELMCDKLSDFLFAMAYLQAVYALPFNALKDTEVTKRDIKNIKKNWKEVNKVKGFDVRYYQNTFDEVIAILGKEKGEDFSINIGAKTKERFDEIDEILKLDWDYTYEDG